MPKFKWSCVILDDQISQCRVYEDIVNALFFQRLNVISGPKTIAKSCALQDLGSKMSVNITKANVILLDVKWEASPKSITNTIDLFKSNSLMLGNAASLTNWLNSFASHNMFDNAEDSLPDEQIGYWLGPAISLVNPTADIVMFTSDKDVMKEYLRRPDSFYYKPHYTVLNKDQVKNDKNLLFDILTEKLTAQQKYQLNKLEFRNWLNIQLLLHRFSVADHQIDERRTVDIDGANLTLENFFPQFDLKKESETFFKNVVPFLRDSFSSEVKSTSVMDDSMQNFMHKLDHFKSSTDDARLESAIDAAIDSCNSDSLTFYKNELDRWKLNLNDAQKKAAELHTRLKTLSTNNYTGLLRLCIEYEGDVYFQDELEGELEGELELPFSLKDLYFVVGALDDNRQKHGNVEIKGRVDAIVGTKQLLIRYIDSSKFFKSWSDFSAAVIKSIENNELDNDALSRGLPLAITRPLQMGATQIDVFIGDTGKWKPIFQSQEANCEDISQDMPAMPDEGMFGLAWLFERQS
jgi:hypothetical protein